jgi:hypothetical protein
LRSLVPRLFRQPGSLSNNTCEARAFRSRERTGGSTVTQWGLRCAQQHQRHEVIAMINASQIKEHMEVKGSDGKHVGTVLGVEGGKVKIASGGMDHEIDIGTVDAVEGESLTLATTAEEAVRTWH